MMLLKPYRLGTTSYMIPGDLRDNVLYLAGRTEDIELVLWDLEDGQSNLPTPQVVNALAQVGHDQHLSYTVHLPQDLSWDENGAEGNHPSLRLAQRVIELTRPLNPWAYVAHLDGRTVRKEASAHQMLHWQDQAVRALTQVAQWAGRPEFVAVENLEQYAPDFIDPVMVRVPEISRCVDVGHLWVDGHDPLPYLQAALPRTRVIHLHGVGDHDHQSLKKTAPQQLDRILELLACRRYSGVVTLEVFGEDDLNTSHQAVLDSLTRLAASIEPQ